MQIGDYLKELARQALDNVCGIVTDAQAITLNETKPEFEGDYTIVLFQFVKQARKSPEQLGRELGEWILNREPDRIAAFQVIKGFLNLTLTEPTWLQFLAENKDGGFLTLPANGKKVMVEYSSPNTNKPLHLGHLRNNFLGWSIAEIFKANGYEILRSCIVNDRGVHICKSMLAWQKFGHGATPASAGKKGDHLVGDFYVMFENELKSQAAPLLDQLLSTGSLANLDEPTVTKASVLFEKLKDSGLTEERAKELQDELKEIARNATPIMAEVRQMLLRWEEGDPATLELWRTMNGWVYQGFNETYKRIGSQFDTIYYESNTYLLGKDYVEEGMASGVFYKKEDGSVWIDLREDGLDEKLVLRKDGTSVYITQDIGLAKKKYEDFAMDQSIYVVGDEQNYHMQVLQLICKKLGMPFADGIHHLSYGMVELPTGRMKSREGTVVDADDICDEMEQVAAAKTAELGKVKDFTAEELANLYHTLGLGALKFFLLRVDPKKRMVFNPEESIDFHGFTGPFVQYTYARIQSVLRKMEAETTPTTNLNLSADVLPLLPLEKDLIKQLEQYTGVLKQSCLEMNPSVIAGYAFKLAQVYNSFYTVHKIANAETEGKKALRTAISTLAAKVIEMCMGLLGIAVPPRM